MKQIQRRELIPAEFLAVIDPWKILHNRNHDLLSDHLHIICRCVGTDRFYRGHRFCRAFRPYRIHIDFLVLIFELLINNIIFLRNFLLLFVSFLNIIFLIIRSEFIILSIFLIHRLIRSLNRRRSLTALAGHCKPSRKSSACKKHPHNRQSNNNQPWKHWAHEIGKRICHRTSGITTETAIKKPYGAKQRKSHRKHKSAADRQECQSHQTDMSLPEKESVCYRAHKEHEYETGKSEHIGNKKMTP